MHQFVINILGELKGSWRFRWHAMSVAWLTCIIGWIIVFALPDSFESHASIYINTSSPLWDSLKGLATQNDILKRVAVEAKSLQSRPELERVARKADLHLRAAVSSEMDSLIASMAKRMSIRTEPRRDPNLYRISFRDEDPAMAKSVVTTLMNAFVEDSLDATRQDSKSMQSFYRNQLLKLAEELTDSEQQLAEFKKRNVGRMPGEGGGYFVRLQAEMAALEQTQSQLRLANRRRDSMLEQLSGKEPMIDPLNRVQSQLDIRIQQNKANLQELQLRFTNLHPDVVAIEAVLEQLNAQKRLELEQLSTADQSGTPSDNPVYQAIQIDLTGINVDIASLREEERSHSRKIDELRELVDVLPQIEVELIRLNRDYDVKQAQYQALLTRLSQAELSESAEASEDARFRIIDPPFLPETPTAPNRALLMVTVLLVGLGVGGGVAYLGNQINAVFSDARTLRDATSIPILGSVQVMRTIERRSWRKRQVVGFGSGMLGLCFLFAILFVFRDEGSRLIHALI